MSKKPGQGTKKLCLNCFDPVMKNGDQLACWKQGFYGESNFVKITVKPRLPHSISALGLIF